MRTPVLIWFAAFVVAGVMPLPVTTGYVPPAAAEEASLGSTFTALPGRWTGQGRLGYKDGKMETVTCRATYFRGETASNLRQTIRCATASGKIELKSEITEHEGKLSGSWVEQMFELAGELSGEITPKGLRVTVKGENLDANMDIIVRENKQVVEIQFHNTSLVGMTLILDRSSSAGGES
ncbi:MAG: hypothetical protein NW216_08010 [Hyphomicrobium sp.]|nr:hypothetical protein [Hyphomicrobium sp.]